MGSKKWKKIHISSHDKYTIIIMKKKNQKRMILFFSIPSNHPKSLAMKYIPKNVHITNRPEKRMRSFTPPTINMESLLCKTEAVSIWKKRKKDGERKEWYNGKTPAWKMEESRTFDIFLHILNLYWGIDPVCHSHIGDSMKHLCCEQYMHMCLRRLWILCRINPFRCHSIWMFCIFLNV